MASSEAMAAPLRSAESWGLELGAEEPDGTDGGLEVVAVVISINRATARRNSAYT